MTSLQVDYWKLKESERTNKANEGLRYSELQETVRHNQASEAIGWAQVGETQRHNVAQEELNLYHENAWQKQQNAVIAIQRDQTDINRDRQKLEEARLQWDTHWNSVEREQKWAEIDQKNRELDQKDVELKQKKSEQTRKWTETVFNGVKLFSGASSAVEAMWANP